ncbi:hypothetical protein K1719_017471 [Acacia pycnantha]|nr:hypothetical protein K1719_017471 [Acacia pycnantha]
MGKVTFNSGAVFLLGRADTTPFSSHKPINRGLRRPFLGGGLGADLRHGIYHQGLTADASVLLVVLGRGIEGSGVWYSEASNNI